MHQWREERKNLVGVQLYMPQAIGKAGERFVKQLWPAADVETGKAIETVKEEFESRLLPLRPHGVRPSEK